MSVWPLSFLPLPLICSLYLFTRRTAQWRRRRLPLLHGIAGGNPAALRYPSAELTTVARRIRKENYRRRIRPTASQKQTASTPRRQWPSFACLFCTAQASPIHLVFLLGMTIGLCFFFFGSLLLSPLRPWHSPWTSPPGLISPFPFLVFLLGWMDDHKFTAI